jgi:GcrA cell cycle regulator
VVVARANPEEEVVVIPMSERVTLMELRESMCRWPMGDPTTPEFRFCGGRSPIGGGSYCVHHARLAHGVGTVSERNASKLKGFVR